VLAQSERQIHRHRHMPVVRARHRGHLTADKLVPQRLRHIPFEELFDSQSDGDGGKRRDSRRRRIMRAGLSWL
jgi:hypothetical protein